MLLDSTLTAPKSFELIFHRLPVSPTQTFAERKHHVTLLVHQSFVLQSFILRVFHSSVCRCCRAAVSAAAVLGIASAAGAQVPSQYTITDLGTLASSTINPDRNQLRRAW